MEIKDFINKNWCDPKSLNGVYVKADPFPHIIMENFIKKELLEKVLLEFPNLKDSKNSSISFNNDKEIKLASKGMGILSGSAFNLISLLNSDFFLEYLQELTGINEVLISDPYLSGGGYHEIKKGGLLKIHADFNKHPKLNLDRRLNLLIYLNKNWEEEWGGELSLFGEDLSSPKVSVFPHFNTAVLFTTRSDTFHGHPFELKCPDNKSRKSLALYYFSTGRPKSEKNTTHSTIFKDVEKNNLKSKLILKEIAINFCPPIILKAIKKIFN